MPASLSTIERIPLNTAAMEPPKGFEYKLLPMNDTDGIAGSCHALNELAAVGFRVVPIQMRPGLLLLERRVRP